MGSHANRIRLGASGLAAAGLLFLLYPAIRPWEDESTVEGATQAMSAGAWIASHLFAMIGFVLVGLGMLALWAAVNRMSALCSGREHQRRGQPSDTPHAGLEHMDKLGWRCTVSDGTELVDAVEASWPLESELHTARGLVQLDRELALDHRWPRQ